jgi:hypothetical protein
MSYAYLSLPSQGVTREIVIVSYSYTYSASIQSSQNRLQLNHYPYRAVQKGMNFTIKCRSEQEWQDLKELIRKHQYDALTQETTSNGFFTLIWPEQDMNYTILVKASPGGSQRFQYSPTLAISADFISDNIFTEATDFTAAGSDFDTIRAIVDLDQLQKPISWTTSSGNGYYGGNNVVRPTTGGGNGAVRGVE